MCFPFNSSCLNNKIFFIIYKMTITKWNCALQSKTNRIKKKLITNSIHHKCFSDNFIYISLKIMFRKCYVCMKKKTDHNLKPLKTKIGRLTSLIIFIKYDISHYRVRVNHVFPFLVQTMCCNSSLFGFILKGLCFNLD